MMTSLRIAPGLKPRRASNPKYADAQPNAPIWSLAFRFQGAKCRYQSHPL
jgi:hypothetical protein